MTSEQIELLKRVLGDAAIEKIGATYSGEEFCETIRESVSDTVDMVLLAAGIVVEAERVTDRFPHHPADLTDAARYAFAAFKDQKP